MRGTVVSAGSGRRITPKSVDQLRDVVAACDRTREAVAIEGGNTLRGMGLPPARADVTVVTTALDAVLEHEYRDLTCAVQAGITLASLAESLAARGQYVPIDAPFARKATVGGTLAAGWLGPRRHLLGRARDYVIGSHVVLADGTLAKAGGMVVKNVSGYDMSKLYVGSFGTLGTLVRVNFKTLPLPQRRRAFVAKLPEGTRSRAIAQIAELAIAPAAAFCVEGYRKAIDGEDGTDGRLFVLLEGSSTLIERATRDLRSALGKAGVPETTILDAGAREAFERVLDATVACISDRSVTYHALGSPESIAVRSIAMRDLAHRHELFTDVLADVMNGDTILRVSRRDARAFSASVEIFDDELHAIEPRATIVAGDSPVRSSLLVWGQLPSGLAKMREIKARFDPNRTLNPGRFVGGI